MLALHPSRSYQEDGDSMKKRTTSRPPKTDLSQRIPRCPIGSHDPIVSRGTCLAHGHSTSLTSCQRAIAWAQWREKRETAK